MNGCNINGKHYILVRVEDGLAVGCEGCVANVESVQDQIDLCLMLPSCNPSSGSYINNYIWQEKAQ